MRSKGHLFKFPFISALIAQIIAVGILLIPLKSIALAAFGEYPLGLEFLLKAMVRTIPAAAFLVLMTKMDFIKYLKWSLKPKYIVFTWPAIILIILNFEYDEAVINAKIYVLLAFLLYYISVGFFEEFIFRGVILCLLEEKWKNKKNGILLSVVASSLMFGSVHLLNLLNKNAQWQEVIGQVLYTAFLGILFAAIMIRTKNIWLSVILHAVFDIVGSFNELIERKAVYDYANQTSKANISDIAINTLLFLPLALFGVFLIRKKALNK